MNNKIKQLENKTKRNQKEERNSKKLIKINFNKI